MLNDWLFRRMMSAPVTPSGDGVNLPTLFQRVEYLQGNGNPYIDTGVALNSLTKPRIVTKFRMTSQGDYDWFGTEAQNAFVAWNVNNAGHSTYIRWLSSGSRTVFYNSGHSVSDLEFNDALHTLDVGGVLYNELAPISVDGVHIGNMTSASYLDPTSNHIRIFRGRNYFGSSQFASFQIYSDGVLVRDMYACYRKSDNKPGMFDLVTRQFFTNANATGNDFTVGPDIPSTSPYIIFVDPAVEAICVANWSQDGIGVTMQDVAAVKTFNGNLSGANDTTATKFNEMVYFTGLGTGADPEYCTNSLFFSGLKAVTEATLPPTLRYISQSTFRSSAFTSIEIPASVEYINSLAFANAGQLSAIIMRRTTPQSIYANAIQGNAAGLKIYVPYSADHSILTAYQTASNWSSHASKMVELNPDGTIPTT